MEQEPGEHGAVLLQAVDTQHAAVAVVAAVVFPPVACPHRLQPPLLSLLSLKQSIVLLSKLPKQQTSRQVKKEVKRTLIHFDLRDFS